VALGPTLVPDHQPGQVVADRVGHPRSAVVLDVVQKTYNVFFGHRVDLLLAERGEDQPVEGGGALVERLEVWTLALDVLGAYRLHSVPGGGCLGLAPLPLHLVDVCALPGLEDDAAGLVPGALQAELPDLADRDLDLPALAPGHREPRHRAGLPDQ